MISQETIKSLRQDILDIAARYGAHDVRMFGSVARGDQCEDSDLDLLVRFDPDRSLLDHGGLVVDLEELLGVPVDVVSENGMRERFQERLAREAIPL
jgi:predicted nucleotidyltransferase